MANRTDTQADTVHGTNPQFLVDRIVRVKIYNDAYWKEFCFGLTNESFIDRAIEIDYVGGTYGGRRRPAKFLCLFLKMLQIQPDEDVVMEYIKQVEWKYLRALGVMYLRISGRPVQVYQTLEPFLADYRKLRYRDLTGKMSLIHMDELVDWLIREETVCDVTMPQLPKREILEQGLQLAPRTSILEDDLADLEDLEEPKAGDDKKAPDRPASPPPAKSSPPRAARSPSRRSNSSRRSRGSRRSRSRRSRSRSRRSPRRRGRSRSGGSRGRSPSRSEHRVQDKKKERKEKADKKRDKKEKKDKREKKAPDDKERKAPGKKDKDGLSVEQWNEKRKELGLKPLK